MAKYLDSKGVSVFWNKTKSAIKDITNEHSITPKNTDGFISNIHYDSDTFVDSYITEFSNFGSGRQDQCLPYIIKDNGSILSISDSPGFINDSTKTRIYNIENGVVKLYNLIPNKRYFYKVDRGDYKSFKTKGTCRWIKLDSLKNVRDLGGVKTSLGKYIRYGLLYRGSEFSGNNGINISNKDFYELTSILGVNTELDLRRIDEMAGHTRGTLSNYLNIVAPDFNDIENISDEEIIKLKNAISYIIINATYGYPLYYHCAWGCHRVGLITCILYGLLGVPQCEIDKEYELSSFSDFGIFCRNKNDYGYKRCNEYISEIYGSWYNWACDKLGIKDDIVEQFRQALIVDYTELPFITEKEVAYIWENQTPDTPYAPY